MPWLSESAGSLVTRPWLGEDAGLNLPAVYQGDLFSPVDPWAKRRRLVGTYSGTPDAALSEQAGDLCFPDACTKRRRLFGAYSGPLGAYLPEEVGLETPPRVSRRGTRLVSEADLDWATLAALRAKKPRIEPLEPAHSIHAPEVKRESLRDIPDDASTADESDDGLLPLERLFGPSPTGCTEILPHRAANIWACIRTAFTQPGSSPRPRSDLYFPCSGEAIAIADSPCDLGRLQRLSQQRKAPRGWVFLRDGSPVALEPLNNEEPELPGLVVFPECRGQADRFSMVPHRQGLLAPECRAEDENRIMFIEELGEKDVNDDCINEMVTD